MKHYIPKIINSPVTITVTIILALFVSVWYIDPGHNSFTESRSFQFIANLLSELTLSKSEENHFDQFYNSKTTNPFFFPKVIQSKYSLHDLERKILTIIRGHKTGLTPFEEKYIASVIVSESMKYGFDPLFILAVIKVESSFNHKAVSYKNAQGLMQIMPPVGAELAEELQIPWDELTLFNPITNIKIGVYFLYKLTKRFKQNQRMVLAAYNFGPAALNNLIKEGKNIYFEYPLLVLDKYKKYTAMKI